MDLDDSYGVKSSFQLVPEDRYEISDAVLANFHDRQFEVNVHDLNHDGRLYANKQEFLRRAQKINAYARRWGAQGFRSGALYRNVDWYDALDFSYDMSVPNCGHLEAQGGGACTIMPYFIGDMVELPLTTTQDYSLFHILGDYSIDLWKRQIQTILQRNGLISFIVHPDYIVDKKAQDTYRALLTYISELRDRGTLWIARPGEVANWWRRRKEMTLQKASVGGWQITGDERGEGRVAQVCLAEENVIYKPERKCFEVTALHEGHS
jgi:hypothetical protein